MANDQCVYGELDQGKVFPHIKYLGGRLSAADSFTAERSVRMKSCNLGWRALGIVWFGTLPHVVIKFYRAVVLRVRCICGPLVVLHCGFDFLEGVR